MLTRYPILSFCLSINVFDSLKGVLVYTYSDMYRGILFLSLLIDLYPPISPGALLELMSSSRLILLTVK